MPIVRFLLCRMEGSHSLVVFCLVVLGQQIVARNGDAAIGKIALVPKVRGTDSKVGAIDRIKLSLNHR
jgi:hypothetical protein